MMSFENHLHDIALIKRVVDILFNNLKNQYAFFDYKMDDHNISGSIYLGIEKNKIIVYVRISVREGFELNILEKGNDRWMRKSFISFFGKIYPSFSKKESIYLKKRYESSLEYEKYSFEYYEFLLNQEINILQKYHSEIFEKGILPVGQSS